MTEHTDKHYEQELRELKEAILKMGGLVEEMIAKAMKRKKTTDISIAAPD